MERDNATKGGATEGEGRDLGKEREEKKVLQNF